MSMKATITNPGPALSEDDVSAFEQKHNVSLPADYRRFLLKFNGGMPSPELLKCECGFNAVIWLLYSLNDKTPFDLDRACLSLDWEEAYDQGILCIGRDPGGSGIFIVSKGDDLGAILFFDREETLRPQSGYIQIASSFDVMMDNLEPL